jgi:hypothetical protein
MKHTISSNRIFYQIMLWLALIISILALSKVYPLLIKPENLPSDDFVPYWASAKLNLSGLNPYDPQKVEQLQLSAGGMPSASYTVSIMLNPPWAISLLLPFGMFDYSISRLAWLLFSTVCILISSLLIWKICSGNPKKRWVAIIVPFIYAPTISVLEVGQITSIILMGITGFLFFSIYYRNDWLAGLFVTLASIKPQVAVIFWIALIFWIIQQRRWLLIIGPMVFALSLTILAYLFNPDIIQQYFSMLHNYRISEWANPTIGAYLRFFWLGTDKFWLQFLPTVIAALWFLYYWYTHHGWDWVAELPMILLISQITSPYSWTYDQVILIPVVIQATIWIISNWKRWSTILISIAFLAISILDLILHMRLSDFWFLWMAPATLILFLIVRRLYSHSKIMYPNLILE